MRLEKKRVSVSRVLLVVCALVWSLITLYPLYITVLSSFKNNESIFGSMFALPKQWQWQNYMDALFGANILTGVRNSLFLAMGTTLLVIALALLASFAISRDGNKLTRISYLIFLTGVMLPVHTTIIPISRTATALNGYDSFWFLLLIYATFQLPQAIFLITGYLNNVSVELDEAAKLDGCSRMETLFRILLPACTPILFTVAILSFIYGYSELIFSVILLHSPAKYPVARSLLYFTGDFSVRMGPVFASIVVAVLPMIIIYLLFHEKVQSGMLAGAVKG